MNFKIGYDSQHVVNTLLFVATTHYLNKKQETKVMTYSNLFSKILSNFCQLFSDWYKNKLKSIFHQWTKLYFEIEFATWNSNLESYLLCMTNSMTSLLTHIVAHSTTSTRPFYRPKINHQHLKKFLSLAVSWVKVVKNGKILTFKVNFLCQKLSESVYFFFTLKNIILEAHFLKTSIFKPLYFLKWCLIFYCFYSTDGTT